MKIGSEFSGHGQSMIEVVIGIGVVVLLAISLVTTSLITQKTARSSRNNAQATKLAQEYIEQIRIYRDRKGFTALAPDNLSCYTINTSSPDPLTWFLDSTTFCQLPGPLGEKNILSKTDFYRKLTIETIDPAKKKVVVTVTWEESGGTKTVTNQTFLAQWETPP